ncbi:GntR family transcriptional regulator/MocR family aminotransferase [Pararhizobium capsulatum DSM 1112]|uniref:GntR family transcriptional regulator/MocR family aminotransferase n=1 Tax=Pararhizobium capsulatum DSM 1112 TaxID=1121113 RepID=A0ABU0BVH1_9HYPH|nr:PLP-dependent aminotransferase family protein [Pararhizobium capsulatum]MDQ0322248.1 GntR family transcriptional regulator/MocR family aminotransferase [Pararhizobium capsulatum DSM 1112]
MKISQLNLQTEKTWHQVFGVLDRDGQPLNIQIRRMIVHAVETGLLPTDARLPSSRELAARLGIGRNTVTAAYQQLIDEGFLASRQRSGIFVCAVVKPAVITEATRRPSDWATRFAMKPSRLPQISKPRDWRSYPYPFLSGQYDPGLFPTNNWREAVRATSSVQEIQVWAADMIDDDDPDLIEQLRVQVLPRRGISAQPGEVMVTLGSQQALSMLVQLFVARDTPVGLEDPGYPDLRNMMRLATMKPVFLTSDDHGLIPDDAFGRCDIAFVTAGHQCPTTSVMPLARRNALLDAAARSDVLLIEDDYDADLSVEADSDIPSLKSLDRAERVIYIGSFSKVLAPGLRIGYVVAPKPVIDELRVLRRLMLRHPPTNNQRSLATFIGLGHYRQHLSRAGAAILERARLIERLLPETMPSCRLRRGDGATSFWIEGPPELDARAMAEIARAQGILVEAGDIFFSVPAQGRNFFRIGFSSIATHRIESGLVKLGAIVEDCGRRALCHTA